MKKSYIVFGAGGSIGSAIVGHLRGGGHWVVSSPRKKNDQPGAVPENYSQGVIKVMEDVSNRKLLDLYARDLSKDKRFDGVIYAVGHCPPNGFPDAIKYPLSQLPLDEYQREVDMHQFGALNVFQSMIPYMKDGGLFLFITSAITRFEVLPPFLHAYHHTSVIAAEDWLIRGMRADPTVVGRNIKIHRIAPSAINTAFHHAGPKPPKLLQIADVAGAVMEAIESDVNVDRVMLPG